MSRVKKNTTDSGRMRPAITPEGRENQLIGLAVDLAEKKLMDGTASSQLICHYLKLGSTREKLEKDILEKQKELITAKTENIQSSKRSGEFYEEVLKAIKRYNGEDDSEDEYDECY